MDHYSCSLCVHVRSFNNNYITTYQILPKLANVHCAAPGILSDYFSYLSYRLHQVSSWVVYAGIVTLNAATLAQYMGYTVEKIIYNKNYNHRSHDSDIALMKLRNPLNFSGDSTSHE